MGYAEYMCGNYETCRTDNESALRLNENDAQALRGCAIALYRLGNRDEGIAKMQQAVQLTDYRDIDMQNDLQKMESGVAAENR